MALKPRGDILICILECSIESKECKQEIAVEKEVSDREAIVPCKSI